MPLQKGKYRYYYFVFTFLFIATGQIILASALNLLVVYFANMTKNRCEFLKRRMIEKKRIAQENMFTGDIIKAKNKQDIVSFKIYLLSF